MNLKEPLIWFDVPLLIEYVNSTRSDDGGYCFYRLNESNAADSFYAIYTLTALNQPVPDPSLTASFLQQRQRRDGSFQSFYTADYVLRGLCLLGVAPSFDPNAFLLAKVDDTLRLTTSPHYERNEHFLEALGTAVALVAFRDIAPPASVKSAVVEAVRPYIHREGGFGIDHASIEATYNALRALTFSPSAIPGSVSAWVRPVNGQRVALQKRRSIPRTSLTTYIKGRLLCTRRTPARTMRTRPLDLSDSFKMRMAAFDGRLIRIYQVLSFHTTCLRRLSRLVAPTACKDRLIIDGVLHSKQPLL